MKRRDFISGLSGAMAMPLLARAQQASKVHRLGVLSPSNAVGRQHTRSNVA